MSEKETESWSMPEGAPDAYFSKKIVEAIRADDGALIHELVERKMLWEERRQLDHRLAREILVWRKEVQDLYDLLDAPSPEVPRSPLFREAFSLCVAMFFLAVVSLVWLFTGPSLETLPGVVLLSVIACIQAFRTFHAWKKERS